MSYRQRAVLLEWFVRTSWLKCLFLPGWAPLSQGVVLKAGMSDVYLNSGCFSSLFHTRTTKLKEGYTMEREENVSAREPRGRSA